MKKLKCLILLLIATVIFSGCTIPKFIEKTGFFDNAETYGHDIIECFEKEDARALKEILSEHEAEILGNADEKIEYLFEFIDGDILEYGDIKQMEKTQVKDDEKEDYIRATVLIPDIKTKDSMYSITAAVYILHDNEEYKGVDNITVFKNDENGNTISSIRLGDEKAKK